jgi:hypothetical protein
MIFLFFLCQFHQNQKDLNSNHKNLKTQVANIDKNLWEVFLFGDLAPWVNLHLHRYHGKKP